MYNPINNDLTGVIMPIRYSLLYREPRKVNGRALPIVFLPGEPEYGRLRIDVEDADADVIQLEWESGKDRLKRRNFLPVFPSAASAARITGVSNVTISRWIRNRRLPCLGKAQYPSGTVGAVLIAAEVTALINRRRNSLNRGKKNDNLPLTG